ncbi:hypothetical protein LXN10_12515 [Arcobacter sp. KX21116]|uniref:hypothetical protein n=1 Tax=Arcobacter iocasae TaxID=2906515 RepID=UPI0035D410EE
MIRLNNTLKIFLLFGTILFCAIFIYSFTSPYKIEKHATGFIKKQIQYHTNEIIDNLGESSSDNKLIKFSQKFYEKNYVKINKLKLALKDNLTQKIASTVVIMQDLNCECRNKYSKFLVSVFDITILNLQKANDKITNFMKMKYMQIVQSIINDFRIFSGSNLVFFLIALILLFFKSKANAQITLVAGLLFLSTIICSYFYIFEQDWFYNIIYQDFFGYFYLMYMGIVFLFLCDIIFNKARITTEIINFIANIIGSGFQALSC